MVLESNQVTERKFVIVTLRRVCWRTWRLRWSLWEWLSICLKASTMRWEHTIPSILTLTVPPERWSHLAASAGLFVPSRLVKQFLDRPTFQFSLLMLFASQVVFPLHSAHQIYISSSNQCWSRIAITYVGSYSLMALPLLKQKFTMCRIKNLKLVLFELQRVQIHLNRASGPPSKSFFECIYICTYISQSTLLFERTRKRSNVNEFRLRISGFPHHSVFCTLLISYCLFSLLPFPRAVILFLMLNWGLFYIRFPSAATGIYNTPTSAKRLSSVASCLSFITIFVNLGLFRHFETVTNIRTWINHTDIGECCKMQILWSGCSYQEPN